MPIPKRGANLLFFQIFRELHENEDNWTWGEGHESKILLCRSAIVDSCQEQRKYSIQLFSYLQICTTKTGTPLSIYILLINNNFWSMAVQLWANDCQKDKIRRAFGMLNHMENFMTKNYVSFSWPTTTLSQFVQRSGVQLKQAQWRKQFWTLLKRRYFGAVEWNLLPNIYLIGYLSDQAMKSQAALYI